MKNQVKRKHWNYVCKDEVQIERGHVLI